LVSLDDIGQAYVKLLLFSGQKKKQKGYAEMVLEGLDLNEPLWIAKLGCAWLCWVSGQSFEFATHSCSNQVEDATTKSLMVFRLYPGELNDAHFGENGLK
jgi:hypothetical protein